MLTLSDLLQQRTHRDLELTAKAHRLPFSRRIPKAEGCAGLMRTLQGGVYASAIQALTPEDRLALQALVAVGGAMDIWQFKHHFGDIRRYRPWHPSFGKTDDNPRHPWRKPISIAEKLYHLGMIHLASWGQVELIHEVAHALPSLPEQGYSALTLNPSPNSLRRRGTFAPPAPGERGRKKGAGVMRASSRSLLLRDLSAFLGVITRLESQAIHGRWLSLTDLREVNSALSRVEDLSDVRSELQAGRIRWLHYLVQVTGLLDVVDDRWFVTPFAWEWLSAPAGWRWDMLWHSVEHDLLQKSPLWCQFRFPDIDAYSATVLRHLVEDCIDTQYNNTVGTLPCHRPQRHAIKDILQMAKPYLLESHPYDLALFIRHMLAWSGIVQYQQGTITVQPQDFAPTTDSQLDAPTWLDRTIPVHLSDNPHSIAFTRLLSFVHIDRDAVEVLFPEGAGFRMRADLTPDTIRVALRQGYNLSGILSILTDLTRTPIPGAIIQLLDTWVKQASRLTLKPMFILESTHPDDITTIRQDWRLRDHISHQLSSNHIAVEPDKSSDLIRRLNRRDYPVTSYLPDSPASHITESLNTHMVDYCLLAVRTYQQLSDRHDIPTTIPSGLTDWLRQRASNPAKTEASASHLIDQIHSATPSPHALPDGLQDHATIERLLRLAYHDNNPITITYYSPNSDETTTRTIRIELIYKDRDQTYLEAFCYRDNDIRTFRLDRVQRVNPPRPPQTARAVS